MSDGVNWDFKLSGDAQNKLDALDEVLAKLPRDLDASEKALAALNRAASAQAIEKMSDPLRQNQALLKLHVEGLKRAEEATQRQADAVEKAAKDQAAAVEKAAKAQSAAEAKVTADIEKAAKAQEKAQEKAEKVREKAEKAEEKAREKAEKAEEKAQEKLERDAQKSDEAIGKALGVDKIAQALTLAGAIEKVGDMLVAAGKAAIDAAIAVTKFGVESGQKTRGQTFALGVTEGDGATKVLANIREMAGNAAGAADKAVERFMALRRAGFGAAEAQNVLAASLDARARNGGGDAGERAADAVAEAFRKSRQTGKIEYAEVFDSLGRDAGIGGDKILSAVATRLKLSNDKALEQLKAGKVPVATVQDAVLDAIQSANPGGKLGDTARSFGAGDLEGQMQRLHDTAANLFPSDFGAGGVRALKTVGDLLNNEPYKGAIKGIVDDFGKLLGGPGNTTIETILRSTIGFVREAIDGVSRLKDGFEKGFNSAAFVKMNEQFDKMDATLGAGKSSKALEAIGFIVGQAVLQLAFWIRAFEAVDALTRKINDSIYSAGKALASFGSESFKALGGSADEGLALGLSGGAPGVEKAAADVGRIPLQVIKAILKIQSPSKEMEQLGIYSGQGFSLGLEKEDPGVALEASLAPTRGGAGAGGGGGVTISFGDIIVSGAGAGAGEAVRDEVYTAILQVIEELGLA